MAKNSQLVDMRISTTGNIEFVKRSDNSVVLTIFTNAIIVTGAIGVGGGSVGVYSGLDSPEGVITASIGSIYLRANGGAVTSLYVKESNSGTNLGWIAK